MPRENRPARTGAQDQAWESTLNAVKEAIGKQDYRLAEKLAHQTLDLTVRTTDPARSKVITLDLFGFIYKYKPDLEASTAAYEEALTCTASVEDPFDMEYVGALKSIAMGYLLENDSAAAFDLLKVAMRLMEKIMPADTRSMSLYLLAEYLYLEDYNRESIQILDRALDAAYQMTNPDFLLITRIVEFQADNCKDMKEYHQAEAAYQKAQALVEEHLPERPDLSKHLDYKLRRLGNPETQARDNSLSKEEYLQLYIEASDLPDLKDVTCMQDSRLGLPNTPGKSQATFERCNGSFSGLARWHGYVDDLVMVFDLRWVFPSDEMALRFHKAMLYTNSEGLPQLEDAEAAGWECTVYSAMVADKFEPDTVTSHMIYLFRVGPVVAKLYMSTNGTLPGHNIAPGRMVLLHRRSAPVRMLHSLADRVVSRIEATLDKPK